MCLQIVQIVKEFRAGLNITRPPVPVQPLTKQAGNLESQKQGLSFALAFTVSAPIPGHLAGVAAWYKKPTCDSGCVTEVDFHKDVLTLYEG